MVDSISGKQNNPIQENNLLNIGAKSAEQVEQLNKEAAKASQSAPPLSTLDNATISDEAKKAYERDREILQFSRLAQRVKESYDAEKVGRLKDMVDSGRINEYLRNLNTSELADSILDGPAGAFLR